MQNIATMMEECGFKPAEQKTDQWWIKDGKQQIVVEIKHRPRAVRDVRALFLATAVEAARDPNVWVYLVLLEPQLSLSRLEEEWLNAATTWRQEIQDKIGLILFSPTGITSLGVPHQKNPQLVHFLQLFAESESTQKPPAKERPDNFFIVLKILLNRWLLGEGAITTTHLMELCGCSYPTVAKSLHRLEHFIHRHTDRRIELKRFPRKDWDEFLLTSDRVRRTVRFADQSGKPRTPDALLQRLYKIHPANVAVGGVYGSRFWYPALNLHGTPRLDLSVRVSNGTEDLSFVEKLDPALAPIHEPFGSTGLAIHFVYHAASLFHVESQLAVPWADPVECLLDLHELRLVEQAHDMMTTLKSMETT